MPKRPQKFHWRVEAGVVGDEAARRARCSWARAYSTSGSRRSSATVSLRPTSPSSDLDRLGRSRPPSLYLTITSPGTYVGAPRPCRRAATQGQDGERERGEEADRHWATVPAQCTNARTPPARSCPAGEVVTVCVTGATGFVGAHVAQPSAERGDEVAGHLPRRGAARPPRRPRGRAGQGRRARPRAPCGARSRAASSSSTRPGFVGSRPAERVWQVNALGAAARRRGRGGRGRAARGGHLERGRDRPGAARRARHRGGRLPRRRARADLRRRQARGRGRGAGRRARGSGSRWSW